MKIIACLLIVVFTVTSKAEEKSDWSVLLQTGFATKYVGKPGILFYDGPVWTNELKVKHKPSSMYGGLWNSTSLGTDSILGDFGDEVDLFLGWEKKFDHIRLDLRVTYIALSELSILDDDRYVIDLRADFTSVKYVTPYVATRYFGRFTDDIPEGGWFIWAGIKRTQPLFRISNSNRDVTLTGDIQVAYSDGALRRETGIIYGRAALTLDIPISKNMSVVPSLMYQLPSGDQTGNPGDYAGKAETVFGVHFKLTY